MKSKVIIYIPAYNCESHLDSLLMDLTQYDFEEFYQFYIIENKSVDNTLSVARSYVQKNNKLSISVISHLENYGLGGSFKTAVSHALNKDADYLIWFHGDYQATLADLDTMMNKLKYNNDCIFGARFMPDSTLVDYSKPREIANRFLNIIYSLALRKRVYELGSGLNAYKVSELPKNIHLWPSHIAFDINLLFHFYNKSTSWMPITWREYGQVSNARNFDVTLKIILMLVKFIFFKKLIQKEDHSKRECLIYEA